ncbi:MAG: hypothetical protein AAF416_14400 [Pseudomonadota bacterium]
MEIDRQSRTWQVLVRALNEKIEESRTQMERFSMDERETMYLRGQIQACRDILAMGDTQDRPIPEIATAADTAMTR